MVHAKKAWFGQEAFVRVEIAAVEPGVRGDRYHRQTQHCAKGRRAAKVEVEHGAQGGARCEHSEYQVLVYYQKSHVTTVTPFLALLVHAALSRNFKME
eukprot:1092922-Prymnesium_polylepis.3